MTGNNLALHRMPWWTSPAGINYGFLLPILVLIAGAGDSSFSGLTIRGIHYLTPFYIALGSLVLLTTGLSGWICSFVKLGTPSATARQTVYWDRAALFVGGVALVAYLVWFRDFFLNPLLIIRTMTGSYRPDRTNIQLTTGITSFANVAPVFFSIYAYKVGAQRAAVSRAMHIMCVTLIGLTLFRVYAWSERLAMIEASVPLGLALFAALARARSSFLKLVASLGPIIAIPMLIVYFAGFEFVRSWQYATYNKHHDFWEFAIGRLVSYYYTSLNNGAGMLTTSSWPTLKFEYVLNWLHKAPWVGPIFSRAIDLQGGDLDAFLTKFGDPEFNNPSGVYAVFHDLGFTLGIFYFCVVGAFGGLMYRAYRSGQLLGVLLYPMFFIAFLEVYRYPYLGTSRAFTWSLGMLLAYVAATPISGRFAHRTVPAYSLRNDNRAVANAEAVRGT